MSRAENDTVLNAEEREIARRLAELPAGEPPPELLERLKADVPDDLARRLTVTDDGDARPSRRRWLAAAAAVITLVGGGWLAWSVWQVTPPAGEVVAPPGTHAAERAEEPRRERRQEAAAAEEPAPAAPLRQTEPAAPVSPDAAPEDVTSEAVAPEDRAAEAAGSQMGDVAETAVATPQARSARGVSAPATEATAKLQVRATDPQGDPLPGATVELSGEGEARRELTDARGEAQFSGLPEGRYRVSGELEGFSGVEAHGVEVAAGATRDVEMELAPAFAEELMVLGEAPMVDTMSISSAATADAVSPPPPPASAKARVGPVPDEAARRAAAPPEPEAEEPLSMPAQPSTVEKRLSAQPAPEPALPVSTFVDSAADRLSTFGLDVDTGSYTALRAALRDGRLPPPAWVRVEEMLNAYRYADPYAAAPPQPGETFRVVAEGAPYPYAPGPRYRLLRFQITARPVVPVERKPAVLTLVVDISGSMDQDGRLQQVKAGLRRMLESLEPSDSVALVTFSDDARVDAPHGDPAALAAAVDALATEGGTNAEAGLALGYETAAAAFREGAVNRVIFLSDGLANIGATEVDALLARVTAQAERGIELTTVGVGMEFNDRLLEQLADRGDGRYLYVDGAKEAERAFVEELTGTLQTVAEEARAQVEIDPRTVTRWRLLGYENRAIADHQFRWDHAVDAGEIGAGQTVTVLYELELADPLPDPGRPLALLKLRWRDPGEELFREEETLVRMGDLAPSWEAASGDLRLAATVAELGEVLRESPHAAAPDEVLREARSLAGERQDDAQAAELVELAERAEELLRAEPEPAEDPTARPRP